MEFPADDYNICPCCGTEFGYDDAGTTHIALRAKWVKRRARWWSPNLHPPADWNAYSQLETAFGPEAIGIQPMMYLHPDVDATYQRPIYL